jgi:hypothetical protein
MPTQVDQLVINGNPFATASTNSPEESSNDRRQSLQQVIKIEMESGLAFILIHASLHVSSQRSLTCDHEAIADWDHVHNCHRNVPFVLALRYP